MYRYIRIGVVFSVLVFTSCSPYIVLWTGCSEKSAFEKHVSEMKNGGVTVMQVDLFSNASSPFTLYYDYNIEGEDFNKVRTLGPAHDDRNFIPNGGKYLMSYDKNKPNNRWWSKQVIAIHHPVYDSTQVFEKTTAEVEKEYFVESRGCFYYGGLQLIFSYKIGDKEYISHNGINLCENFPDVENPEEELSFVGKKFVVEYDVDNP